MNLIITGGSGLVGNRLTEMLRQRGYRVSHLGRTRREGEVSSFTWDIKKPNIDPGALTGTDAIIHLAGAGIAERRWTSQRKKEILESRTASTRLLYHTLKKGGHRVRTLIAASAIGYYGFEAAADTFSEGSPPGSDFLAKVTARWEEEVDRIGELGIRVVKIRTGIVLSKRGGALEEIMRPVKYYVGAPLGTGDQYMSWIHVDDLCGIYSLAISNSNLRGVFNGVAPAPISNRDFTRAIARALGKPILLPPIPKFALRLLLGEMADLVLNGAKVSAQKILGTGFKFRFPTIDSALNDLLLDT
jgi:hypothetical protein